MSTGTAVDNVVRTKDVRKVYTMGKVKVEALKGVDVEIRTGEYLSIMGPSGSGKSTLFNMIGGLDKPTSGKVYIEEVDVAQLDAYELAWLRCRKIGYIFQSFNIIPVMTALENVTLPMTFAGLTSDESRDKGMELLKKVGLDDRATHKPFELSGGQQQRVAIARAMANDPSIILADEPTGNLDLATGREIIGEGSGLGRPTHLRVLGHLPTKVARFFAPRLKAGAQNDDHAVMLLQSQQTPSHNDPMTETVPTQAGFVISVIGA